MAKNKEKNNIAEIEVPDGYLTLKEASLLTDYTPDYIGQLVRAGKIEGKQVYSNMAWVTSEESLRRYLEDKGKVLATGVPNPLVELPDFARPLLYLVIGCSAIFLVILIHILSISIDRALTSTLEERVLSTSQDI